MKDIVFDIEVYPNFVYVLFKRIDSDSTVEISLKGENSTINEKYKEKIYKILNSLDIRIFGYNSDAYDKFILYYILQNKTVYEIYELNNHLIIDEANLYELSTELGMSNDFFKNHYDLKKRLVFNTGGLKAIGVKLGVDKLQNLPVKAGKWLKDEQMEIVAKYCHNDIKVTEALYNSVKSNIEFVTILGKKYKSNFNCYSDVQIAERIMIKELEKNNVKINKLPVTNSDSKTSWKTCPSYTVDIDKHIPKVKEIKNRIINKINERTDDKLLIELNDNSYQIGLGGLHSKEQNVIYSSTKEFEVLDIDVSSFYPSIIKQFNLFPKHIGVIFNNVYRKFIHQRLEAKHNNDKTTSDTMKLVLNGLYGKFGNKYSYFYSPELITNVTITGQLLLLNLIYQLELEEEVKVISANTDGLMVFVRRDERYKIDKVISDFKERSGMEMEITEYDKVVIKDVNNYFAKKKDGGIKTKGIFAKNVNVSLKGEIIYSSVVDYFLFKKPLGETIRRCDDLDKFVFMRYSKEGLIYENNNIGKIARWVWVNKGSPIRTNLGDKVVYGDNVNIVEELSSFDKSKLDYKRYVNEAQSIVNSLNGLNKNMTFNDYLKQKENV